MGSTLLGQRPLAFIHDEVLFEFDDDEQVTERAHEAARIMIAAMKLVMPDMNVTAKPALMRRWSKDAEPVYDDRGRLQVWTPK
jgi:DNA polymerase-1